MKRKKLQKDRKNATENKLKKEWVNITLRSLIDVPPPPPINFAKISTQNILIPHPTPESSSQDISKYVVANNLFNTSPKIFYHQIFNQFSIQFCNIFKKC